MKVEEKGNVQELMQSNPTSRPKTKRENSTSQTDNRPRKIRNQKNSSFPDRWSFSYPIKAAVTSFFYLFSILGYKTELNGKHNSQLLHT